MERTVIRQALVLIGLTLAFILILALLLFNQAMGQINEEEYFAKLTAKERTVAKEIEQKYLGAGKTVQRYFGNVNIAKEDEIDASMVVMKGNAEIDGEIHGDLIVIYGLIVLSESASIDGNVVTIGGKVWRSDGARIRGDIVETSLKKIREYYDDETEDPDLADEEKIAEDEDIYQIEEKIQKKMETMEAELKKRQRELEHRDRELEWKMQELTKRKNRDFKWAYDEEDDTGPGKIRFNRVEGLFLGLQLPSVSQWLKTDQHFAIFGHGGYGFKNKEWRYQIGLQRWFGDVNRFTVGTEAHRLTDTQDEWVISSIENSLAALFLKEDFQDFYRREGFSVFASQNFSPVFQLRGEYRRDDVANMENKNNWALFGNKKKYRPNPLALPAGLKKLDLGSLVGHVTIDSRNDRHSPDKGWYIDAMGEISGQNVQSDLEFERYILEVQHYQPIGWNENLNIRLRAGTSSGDLPPMYWYDLGGISTLSGYRYKEFTGNRMVLGNLEYVLRTANMSHLDLLFLNSFNLILFVDSGYAWFANDENTYKQGAEPQQIADIESAFEGFDSLDLAKLKTNVGIGLASEDDDFRINFAKRTDRGGDDITVTFRISAKFK